MYRTGRRRNNNQAKSWVSIRNQNDASSFIPGKRSVRRAIRAFLLFGQATYRGKSINSFAVLTQSFEINIIQQVRQLVEHLRLYWAIKEGNLLAEDVSALLQQEVVEENKRTDLLNRPVRDNWVNISTNTVNQRLFGLRERLYTVGNPQYPRYKQLKPVTIKGPSKKVPSTKPKHIKACQYNLQSAVTPGRLEFLTREACKQGIHVMFLQSLKVSYNIYRVAGRGRVEWGIQGSEFCHYWFVGWLCKSGRNAGGVGIIFSIALFPTRNLQRRIDPPTAELEGRLGALVFKKPGNEGYDLMFQVGYPFQETATQEKGADFGMQQATCIHRDHRGDKCLVVLISMDIQELYQMKKILQG